MKLKVFSIVPISLIDSRHDACMVIFLSGCNMRCIYCQNYPAYLNGRVICGKEFRKLVEENWAIGVVKFSGGEPTLQGENLVEAFKIIRDVGRKPAIDTNGTKPDVIEKLCRAGLFEAAVDFKAPPSKYEQVTRVKVDVDKIVKTIRILNDYNIDYEIRTTVVLPLISLYDLKEIARILNKLDVKLWVLQRFRRTKYITAEIKEPTLNLLRRWAGILEKEYSIKVKVR